MKTTLHRADADVVTTPEGQLIESDEAQGLRVTTGDRGGLPLSGGVKLSGPKSILVGDTAQFRILNYDVFTDYQVTCETGSVSRTGKMITYVGDSAGGLPGLQIGIDSKWELIPLGITHLGLQGNYKQLTNSGPAGRNQSKMVADGSGLYLWGGFIDDNQLWYYRFDAQVWEVITNEGPVVRYGHAMALHERKIYIYAGNEKASGNRVGTLNIFDLDTLTWTTGASGLARTAGTFEVYNNKIYAYGGLNTSGNALSSLAVYDITNNSWSYVQSCPVAKQGHVSSVIGDGYYIYGGYGSGALFWKYDFTSDSWTSLVDIGDLKKGVSFTVDRFFYILQGTDGILGEYDTENETWRLLQANDARSNASATSVNGSAYYFSGQIASQIVGDLWEIS